MEVGQLPLARFSQPVIFYKDSYCFLLLGHVESQLGACVGQGLRLQRISSFRLLFRCRFLRSLSQERASPGKQASMEAVLLELFVHCSRKTHKAY